MAFRPTRPEQHKALASFLSDAFQTDELRRLVYYNFGDDSQTLVDSVNWNAPPVKVVDALVTELLARRVLSDLWQALYTDRPRRRGEIAAVERALMWRHIKSGPIKILIAAAEVDGAEPLNLEREMATILAATKAGPHGDQFEFVLRRATTWDALSTAVTIERPQIVQFSGHGDKFGTFAFVRPNGGADLSVSAEMFAGLLIEQCGDIATVLLNACYSQVVADKLGKNVDYVIGMNEAVYDAAAIRFSTTFYGKLAEGTSIPEAFGLAANEMHRFDQRSVPQIRPERPK